MTNTTETPTLVILSSQLYYAYARAVDEGDLEALRSMVTEDVQVTRGHNPPEHGVEAFLDIYRAHNSLNIPVCKHVITNVMSRRDGAEIKTHAYFEATYFEHEQTRVIAGLYSDVHVDRGGEFMIAHKRILVQRVLQLPASSDSYAHVKTA